MGEISDRYRRRADRFEAIVAGVPEDRWDDPSPCAEWTARDVVGHVVDMHGVMFQPLGRSLSPAPSIADDPLGAFRSARADVEALLDDPAVAATECDTPMGRTTVEQHVEGVPSQDMVIHGWDLAKATDQHATIAADEVDRMWPGAQQIGDEMRTPGFFGPGIVVFGPAVPVPDDAPVHDRLLGLFGRDPHWSPIG